MTAVVSSPNLVYRHEPLLLLLSMLFGGLVWLAVVGATFGVILVYLAIGFVAYLFAQSGFIAHLRGNAVELGPDQYGDLHEIYLDCCRRLEILEPPAAYLMMSDGILNALATKFLRRRYVVLYSSVVEALRKHPEALRFYFGHELGHIRRGHLDWSLLRWPASLLPLLGAGYRRAQEYTCDLHGLACCQRPADAVFALSVLAAGNERWPQLNARRFAAQSVESGAFWMSFHELTADYPWLSKRVAHVMAEGERQHYQAPRRNPFAWLLAMFIPRLGVGGGASGLLSLLIVVAMLGVLAAIAIPAYQDYLARAKVAEATPQMIQLRDAASEYVARERAYPAELADIGLDAAAFTAPIEGVEILDEGLVLRFDGSVTVLANKTIVLQAYIDDSDQLQWRCTGGTLEAKYRPADCRP